MVAVVNVNAAAAAAAVGAVDDLSVAVEVLAMPVALPHRCVGCWSVFVHSCVVVVVVVTDARRQQHV